MSNIKFQLTKFEKGLAFQVLEMNEEWRKDEPSSLPLVLYRNTNNKIFTTVISDNYVELGGCVSLRGIDKNLDFKIDTILFGSNTRRDIAYLEIINLLKEFSEEWDKKQKRYSHINSYSDIYEF
jgi:hypothetical protein